MEAQVILIVEDDELISRAIQNGLKAAGYDSRAASSRSQGVTMALESSPSLLVLDLSLPDGTGWQVLEAVRQASPTQTTPVIVISSNHVTRSQLREHGVYRFIPKPFDMAYLVETIRELLPSYRL